MVVHKIEQKTQIEIIISSIFALIINLSLSFTQLLKEYFSENPMIQGYGWLPPLIILCFFIAETAGIYGILFRLLNLGEFLEND